MSTVALRAIAATLKSVSHYQPPTAPSAIQAVLHQASADVDDLPYNTRELEELSARMHDVAWCEAHSLRWCCECALAFAEALLHEADAIDRRTARANVTPMLRAFSG